MNEAFGLSAEQGKAILDMKLQRLTGMEQQKIRDEMAEIKHHIEYLNSIIQNEQILVDEVTKELYEIKSQYGDERRSKIEGAIDILTEADLIPDEDVVITLTTKGYVKRVPLDTYGVQHRGGKGKMGMSTLEGKDDVVQDLFVTKNHDTLLFFTNLGRIYSVQVFEIPEASRIAKGRAVVNLLPLQEGERIVKLLCARELEGKHMVMLTKNGIIKRTEAESFAKIRTTGIRAASLKEGDELVFCSLSTGSDTIIIATAHGQGIRFKEGEVRSMGRQAAGVIGIRLKGNDFVVGMEVISTDAGDILFATQNGYGKKVSVESFRVAHRGGVGVRTIPTDKRNGDVIGLTIVYPDSNILLIDQAGKIIRLPAKEVRTMGRQAKGVRLVRLDSSQKLASISAFRESSEDEENSSDSTPTGGITAAVKDTGVKRIVAPGDIEPLEMDGFDDLDADNGMYAAQETDAIAEEIDTAFEERIEPAQEDLFAAEDQEESELSFADDENQKVESQVDIFSVSQQEEDDPFGGF